MQAAVKPQFFKKPLHFRKWLQKNHKTTSELLVGFYKVGSGKESITWPQAVDEALCFGWIDGVRKSVDEHSYTIRFTPRKPGSIWSSVNVRKVEALKNLGLMEPAGLAIFEKKKDHLSGIYTHEKEPVKLSQEFEKLFKANKKAWKFLQQLAPSHRNPSLNWVMSAKQEKTKIKRLNELIKDSEEGRNKWKDYKKQTADKKQALYL